MNTPPSLRLNNYLPYLINRIGPPLEAGFARPLADAGVTLQMWRVLAVLHEYGDQPVGALAHFTSIRVSTLSRLIGRMAERGLVARRRGQGDARSVTVRLRGPGRKAAERLIPEALAYEEAIAADFTEAELATFKQLLIKADRAVRGLGTAEAPVADLSAAE